MPEYPTKDFFGFAKSYVDALEAVNIGSIDQIHASSQSCFHKRLGMRNVVIIEAPHAVGNRADVELAERARGARDQVGHTYKILVRQSDQMVVLAPNVGWQNLPLPRMLLVECGLDLPVVVENEAALAALAETRRGAALNLDSVLCVWGEVGIGGGTVSGGQLMQGASGFAGEIGHLPINLDGERCGCGAIGCLETELGEESLLRRAGRPPNGGRAALTELFADAAAGKPSVIDALAEQGRWLGIGLAGVINLLDPDVVVLGGFLGEALPFMVDTMKAELDTRSIAAIRRDLSVVAGACGSHAPLLGAAEMAWERVISNPLESLERRMFVSELA